MKKGICSLIMLIVFVLSFSASVFATETAMATSTNLIIDNADLLTFEEEASLFSELRVLQSEYDYDFVILTESSIDKPAESYADDYYDYNGYNKSGVLLLVSMSPRKWHISTSGECIKLLTDADLQAMSNDFASYLSNGDYYTAFDSYIGSCKYYLDNNSSDSLSGLITAKECFIAILVGIGLGAFLVFVLIKKQKSVAKKVTANNYLKSDSVNIRSGNDWFICRNIKRTPIQKKSGSNGSSGGNSSTHTSSSGSSHGGAGGSF